MGKHSARGSFFWRPSLRGESLRLHVLKSPICFVPGSRRNCCLIKQDGFPHGDQVQIVRERCLGDRSLDLLASHAGQLKR
jgi:hypothetical protein